MTRCLMVLSVAGLFLGGVASASVQQGDTELDFLGGFTTQNSSGATSTTSAAEFDSWFVSGALGYFLTDNLQVQGAAMGESTSFTLDNPPGTADQDVDVDMFGFGGRAKWHFMPTNQQMVPYIGAQFFWTEVDLDMDALGGLGAIDTDLEGSMWGPVAGLRFMLNEMNDFFVEYQYQIWEGDIGDILDDGHGIFVGIVHQFK